MLNAIAFGVLGFALLLGAVNAVTAGNVVHAAFWLLECACASAGFIWFLGAEYIAIIQLLVYAGAVGILVIFTVMVTHRSYEDAERQVRVAWLPLVFAAALFGLLAYGILTNQTLASMTSAADSLTIAEFGRQMFSPDGWTLAFEIASLVLTVGLIAAVWWTRDTDTDADGSTPADTQGGDA
ncbi:MAG: NADH-quinone oxidoreductase subunit J [Actinomycetes bacterium]|nr:NADH-quinone oxidoreductase subunit J [Actinomycetes bacterium]